MYNEIRVSFLQYVAQDTDEVETEDDYVKMLQERIKSIKKNRDWEGKYMLLEEMMREERMEGMQEESCLQKIKPVS